MPASEANMWTSVFIIHRPYFQHPNPNLFWTQDQVYEWFTAPHPAVIDNEIQSNLHNYLCQLNHQTPPHRDIFHTFLGPQHDMLSAKKSTIATNNIEFLGITIKDGHYQPGKYIAQELIHFPDQNLSKREIQQFLD